LGEFFEESDQSLTWSGWTERAFWAFFAGFLLIIPYFAKFVEYGS